MKAEILPGAWVLESFRRGGVDLDALTRQLPEDVHLMLYEMDTILPDRIERLLQACANLSGNQSFGLSMNELVDISMYGLFGYILLNSGTVKDLFETLVRYHTVHHDGGIYYKMTTQTKTVCIEFFYDNCANFYPQQTTDWGLGFIPLYLKPFLAHQSQPLSAHFSYHSPTYLPKLQTYFGPNLEFKQKSNQLIYPRSILNKRLSKVDLNLLKILRNEADRHLLAQKKENTFLKEIKIILFQHMSEYKTNTEDVANILNLSLSTFKRKLIKEGINFKKTKEIIKNELAQQLLSETHISISNVAGKTGFKNPSSFTRFFIRCNQQKPLEYRKMTSGKKTKRAL